MKAFRGTFIFTIIVVAACVFSYFEVFKKGNEETEQKDKDSQLYKLTADEVSKIELTANGNVIILEKKAGDWSLEKPLIDKADQLTVKNFLDSILREKTSDVVEEDGKANFKTYGLDHPSYSLKLIGANKTEQVNFGSVKAYDGSEYAQFENQNKVYLAPAYLETLLNKKPSDFRNKSILITSTSDIDHLKINGSEKVELNREKENWKILQPKDYTAVPSEASVKAYLDFVKNIKGSEIVSDQIDAAALKKYHLDKPAVTLQLHRAQAPQDYELKISNSKEDKDHNLYMTSSDAGSILKGVASNFDVVNKSVFDFTDKKQAFTFGTADTGGIVISTLDFKANLKKEGNGWVNVDQADKREIDVNKTEDILMHINHLEAKAIVKTKADTLKNSLTVSDSSAKQLFKMTWGEPYENGKLIDVMTSKSKDIYSISTNQIQGLGLKNVFKQKDPIQVSKPPPPKRPGAALDERIVMPNNKKNE